MIRKILNVVLVLQAMNGLAQVNGYAQVTAISGDTCSIGTAQEAYGQFEVGKHVVIMQMQDDVIGENTFNNDSFGALGNIHSAGLYSIREITDIVRSGATLTHVILDSPPDASFNFGSNASVQLITYEKLGGGGDFTTTANIGALPWNGTIGGVIAFHVDGKLTLQHNISADLAGFRGGARTTTLEGPCDPDQYVYDSADPNAAYYAGKGEGIYKRANTAWERGRGRLINGGGGGNGNNAGGGGGSNLTAGGDGGAGYTCSSDPSGGTGGVALGAHTTGERLFMGGGGGGGQGNSNASSVGARGGGIILIRATSIATSGSCGSRSITANGGSANASGADGAGGGGAGGSILLHVATYDLAAGCPLTVSANGGNGGSVNNAAEHGGGGGGGQGAVLFLGMVPIGNINVATLNGNGGCNNNIAPCAGSAGDGGGMDNAGILTYGISPLPIQLLVFDAVLHGDAVDLQWKIASEQEDDLYVVERSNDGEQWFAIHSTPSQGGSADVTEYAARDADPLPGLSYYRLKRISGEGTDLSHLVPVQRKGYNAREVVLYPNPTIDLLRVYSDDGEGPCRVDITDGSGRTVMSVTDASGPMKELHVGHLPQGVYLVTISSVDRQLTKRLTIQR